MSVVPEVYMNLQGHFGEQHWWPTTTADKKVEIIIGAVLAQ